MDKILILGVPSGGLFALRQLRRQYPKSKIYVISTWADIGHRSSKADKIFCVNNRSKEDFLKHAKIAYNELGGGEIHAFIYSNRMLEFITESGDELINLFLFENPISTYKILIDKNKTEEYLNELQIPQPQKYSLNKDLCEELPVVIKPNEKFETFGAAKCAFAENQEQLHTYITKVEGLGISRDMFICQQMIAGNNDKEYGYGGYFRDGKPVIDICFHEFRQEPQGLCCYTREITNEKIIQNIKRITEPILSDLRYNGFIEFDIKEDANTGKFYLLDINPRPWGSADMLLGKIKDSTVFEPKFSGKNVIWRNYLIEKKVDGTNRRNIDYNRCKEITGDNNFTTIHSMWDWHDPLPYLNHIKKYFVRKLRGQ